MKRATWWMIGGGAAGVLVSAPMGLFPESPGWLAVWMTLAVISGLVFAGGAMALSGRGMWMAVLAFVVGSLAPGFWTLGMHSFVLHEFAGVEKCRVTDAVEDHKTTDKGIPYTDVDYVITCASGTIEKNDEDADRWLVDDLVDVYQLPPVRPQLVQDLFYEPWLLWGAPLAMAALLGLAIAIWRHDYRKAVWRASWALKKRPRL